MLEKQILEEDFFFWFHYRTPPWLIKKSLPVYKRKWFINRFIQQKEKEQQEIEKAKKRK